MWCLGQFPYRWQMGIGRTLGRAMARFGSKRRHIARVNLALCMPDLSEAERNRLLQRHLESVGMAMVETAMSWWTPDERLRPLAHIDGMQHLYDALQQGRGAIILIGHFTTMPVIARILAMHTSLHVTYRQDKNPLFQAMFERAQMHHGEIISHTDFRSMFRALKANEALWYAPDQNYFGKHSAFVPFFGVPASTITATTRITNISGAPLIPLLAQRLPDDAGYRITLQAPLEDFPGTDEVSDAARILGIIENHIRQNPEQYLWVHRRFKTRPPGEKAVY